ncbi:MAG: flagellar hook-associated protein 3 [Deltaproteobacteria bacterium]|nr:MAG: flagellar hook-associated protein 3 [Deltaproteobacteria bacterium]
MRVANTTIYDMVKFNLNNITEELNKANKVVSTGKRINNLSDDPVGLNQVLNIKSALSNIEQLGRNISLGKSWLTASESALTQVQNQISDAKALCVQMATATTGSAERASAAATVQNTLEEIVSLTNTEVNGRYVFAGSKTDAAPFSRDNDTNVVTYNGDNKAFTMKIGRDATVEVGSDGEAVFGDIFTTLSDLKDALEADDVSGIQAAMSNLDTHFDRISTKISEIGSKMLRMEIKENILQDLKIANTDRLSKIEDADITEAIMDLKAKELAYKAALASSARVMQLSLVDYL